MQAYLDQMSTLMLDHHLRTSEKNSPERHLATARTLTVVKRQSPESKGDIVNFLYEADLIKEDQPTGGPPKPIVSLVAANLREVKLNNAALKGVDLHETYLQKAEFHWAVLRDSDLHYSDLSDADLSTADLSDANLSTADLSGANLRGDIDNGYPTVLSGANLRGADLSGADLRETEGLTQEQIDAAMGDQKTQLPAHLKRPDTWSLPIEEQIKRLPPIGGE